jgi:hypothetical protein
MVIPDLCGVRAGGLRCLLDYLSVCVRGVEWKTIIINNYCVWPCKSKSRAWSCQRYRLHSHRPVRKAYILSHQILWRCAWE